MRADDRGDDVDEPRELPLTLCQRPLHPVIAGALAHACAERLLVERRSYILLTTYGLRLTGRASRLLTTYYLLLTAYYLLLTIYYLLVERQLVERRGYLLLTAYW